MNEREEWLAGNLETGVTEIAQPPIVVLFDLPIESQDARDVIGHLQESLHGVVGELGRLGRDGLDTHDHGAFLRFAS
jgi:hypothetical protein